MHLFLTPSVAFEKVAAEVRLPEDPNQWPVEIVQELYKQVPYISDFDTRVVMQSVDGERAYGFGFIEVRNKTAALAAVSSESSQSTGVREVRIPIVIKEGKLSSLDILVTSDSRMMPLTESRLRQAIFRPQMFDIASRSPGDSTMIGQLYPPQRSMFGYGNANTAIGADGLGKIGAACEEHGCQHSHSLDRQKVVAQIAKKYPDLVASVTADTPEKHASILQSILHTINAADIEKFAAALSDANVRGAYTKNLCNTQDALRTLASYQEGASKIAMSKMAAALPPTVVQLSKTAGGYLVRSANRHCWDPTAEVIDRGELVKRAGVKVALAVDTEGTVTIAAKADVPIEGDLPDAEHPESIHDFGVWKVRASTGEELIGYVFPTLVDLDGQVVPVALFTNGSQAALQTDICGIRVGDGASLFASRPRGRGLFYKVLSSGKAVGTIPLTLKASLGGATGEALLGETFDGQPAKIVIQPGIKIPSIATSGEGGLTAVVPSDWSWLSLEQAKDVVLADAPESYTKQAEARRAVSTVTIRAGGPDVFALDGMPVDKLAGVLDLQSLSFDDATLLLAGMGVSPAFAQEKLACATCWTSPMTVHVDHMLTLPSELTRGATKTAEGIVAQCPELRRDLFKEAAFIPDPTSVDTVLSLGFINPMNIATFVECLPTIDDAQQRMCELLLGARLGLPDIPVAALERAIRETEEVYEGLKGLAFSKN